MPEDIQTTSSRLLYTRMRHRTKCPVITASKLDGLWVVECQGDILGDRVKAANSWDAKAQGVLLWNERQSEA